MLIDCSYMLALSIEVSVLSFFSVLVICDGLKKYQIIYKVILSINSAHRKDDIKLH